MNAQVLLEKIRSTWLHRVAHSMARGEDVRVNFEKELEQFYSLLEQSVATGDPAWLDSILYYQAPAWVFMLCYTLFGLLVLVSWFWVRPDSLKSRKPNR